MEKKHDWSIVILLFVAAIAMPAVAILVMDAIGCGTAVTTIGGLGVLGFFQWLQIDNLITEFCL